MLLRIIHLTLVDGRKIAVAAGKICYINEPYKDPGCIITTVTDGQSYLAVSEPYDQVLRMWADALSEK